MNGNERRNGEVVDRATEALCSAPLPDGPSEEVLEAVLAAGTTVTNDDTQFERIRQRRRVMTRIARIAAVLLVAAGIVALTAVMIDRSPKIAFAQVREHIQQLRSVSFRMHLTFPAEGQKLEFDMKCMYRLPRYMRQEISMETGQSTVNIYDFDKGAMLVLNGVDHSAMRINIGQLPEEIREQMREKNGMEELLKTLEGDAEALGEKDIDGRAAAGFHVVYEGQSADIWVDPATGQDVLLVEMDIPGSGHIRMTDFVIDPQLDDSLFALEIPEGYTERAQMNLPLDDITEKDLIEGLRFLAECNGNKFPAGPNITPEIVKNMEKTFQKPEGLSKEEAEKWEMETGMAFAAKIARLALFGQMNAATFKYVGEGVTLGDQNSPVCWYKPKGSETYRLVYGHLGVADVEEADLPKEKVGDGAAGK